MRDRRAIPELGDWDLLLLYGPVARENPGKIREINGMRRDYSLPLGKVWVVPNFETFPGKPQKQYHSGLFLFGTVNITSGKIRFPGNCIRERRPLLWSFIISQNLVRFFFVFLGLGKSILPYCRILTLHAYPNIHGNLKCLSPIFMGMIWGNI